MYAAASGMAAQQQNLDVIADNLANADVVAFKSAQAMFEPLGPNAMLGTISTGVRASATQGKLERSGGPFDVALDGPGFFCVEREGVRGYTRAGSFSRAADGSLSDSAGWQLRGVRIPTGARSVAVAENGDVTVDLDGGTRARAGRIELAGFNAPESLRTIDVSVFVATPRSGAAHPLDAGGERQTKIAFGMLEKSNVSIVESMMAILAAQRAYEANAKGVQAADEMLRIANNLHRS
jgi:flagellar basal-body rod protein FlgG